MKTDTASTNAAEEPWRKRYRHMRVLKVLRVTRVTPMMHRVTLGGDEIRGIKDAPNLKLVIPPRGTVNPVWPITGSGGKLAMPGGHPAPTTRTYSLRRLDPAAGELDIDFVMHGPGIASTWAEEARPGDLLGIGGPAGPEVPPAEFHLLAGDHTALPAISRILTQLPDNARGQVFVEVPNREEEQDIPHPSGMTLTWIHSGETRTLEQSVREMAWRPFDRLYWPFAHEAEADVLDAGEWDPAESGVGDEDGVLEQWGAPWRGMQVL